MDEKIIKAKEAYAAAIAALDGMNWTYDRDDENLAINTGAKGDDFPIRIIIRSLAESETLSIICPLGFDISEKARVEAAIAVTVANYGMIRGSFDYDFMDGEIRFRISAPFTGTELAPSLIELLILIAVQTVDEYNDKFFMISKGMLSIQDFIKQERGETD